MTRPAIASIMLISMISCADGTPTSPNDTTKQTLNLNLAVDDPISEHEGQFPGLGFEGIAFGDQVAGGDIGLDTITGEIRIRNWQTGQQVFAYLDVPDFMPANEAFSNLQRGDLNAVALQNPNPFENMPPDYNPARAEAPIGIQDAAFFPGTNSVASSTGSDGKLVLVRRWEPWMTPAEPSGFGAHLSLPESLGVRLPHLAQRAWIPSCTSMGDLISGMKQSYLAGRRSYITGLLGAVNWTSLAGSDIGLDGRVRVGLNTNPYERLVQALNAVENTRGSIVYDITRVLYNSYGCEGTLRALLPVNLIWNSDYRERRTPRGGDRGSTLPPPGAGGGVASGMVWREDCTIVWLTYAVSRDGGATWQAERVPYRSCVDVRVE
jgi:hypothetical protein